MYPPNGMNKTIFPAILINENYGELYHHQVSSYLWYEMESCLLNEMNISS